MSHNFCIICDKGSWFPFYENMKHSSHLLHAPEFNLFYHIKND